MNLNKQTYAAFDEPQRFLTFVLFGADTARPTNFGLVYISIIIAANRSTI